MTTCHCGALHWFGGAFAIYQDGWLHQPDLPCLETEDLTLVGVA